MVGSLSNRIIILCSILCAMMALLAILLLQGSAQTRESLSWVTHSEQVISTANASIKHLQAAESGQRGYTLTRNAEFGQQVAEELASARRETDELLRQTSDNPAQHARARQIRALILDRTVALEEVARLARSGDFAAAAKNVAEGRGRYLMEAVEARVDDFLNEERQLSLQRMQAVELRLNYIRWLVLVATPFMLVFISYMAIALINRIRRPMGTMKSVMSLLGAGDRSARIDEPMNSVEFEDLAKGLNAMADDLQGAVADQVDSEERLRVANLELALNSEVLRERGEVIELLGGMAHRMQAARTDEELASIIHVFVPRVLPDMPGALYAHNNSRNLLVPLASWAGLEVPATGFAPDQCWALRRGQSHFVAEPGSDIVCAHAAVQDGQHEHTHHYHCEPLLAGGEVIGVLYLKGIVGTENRFRLTVLSENIASALVNHRLQRGLREQTIRDPLTGLFNRRYMEEALTLEIARASRSGMPMSIAMCDVDHFKRFNDEFGHEAGDAVLQAVASELRTRFRDGDVVCRFGGEEFTIIAPGASAITLADRAEIVRQSISELMVQQGGRKLGSLTMSFGIATWAEPMERDGSGLIKAADAALYRAKREGRNRVVVDTRSETLAA